MCCEGELDVGLDLCMGWVPGGGEEVDLDKIGRKVETGRTVLSAAGRGALM